MKTILLVDEDIDVLVTLGELLNGSGYRVIPKTSGESAISVVKEGNSIDLVILNHSVIIEDPHFLMMLRRQIPSVPFLVLMINTAANAIFN